MYERFTDRARKVMQLANQEAKRCNHEYLGTEHLLLGLVKEGSGVAANVLECLDVRLRQIRLEVERLVECGPDTVTTARLPQTPRAKKVIEYSMEEARQLNHNYVGTEHLLLGLLRNEGVAALVLTNLGIQLEEVREEVLNLLGHGLEGKKSKGKASGRKPREDKPHRHEPLQRASETIKTCESSQTGTLRILDAAANRALEGLRVVEDFARFQLDDAHLTRLAKYLRHALAKACTALPLHERHAARDTRHDVGVPVKTLSEKIRRDAWEVCVAGLERAKQSLRSLEEYSKVAFPHLPERFEELRYELYTVERSLGITQQSSSRLSNIQLCLLIDGCDTTESFRNLITALKEASAPMIQLRDKHLPDVELIKRAQLLRSTIPRRSGGTLLIVNDRADIAVAADADGVHLGQDDMRVKDARAIVGPRRLIGVSTHSVKQAQQAVLDGASYLGAGPTFPSATKSFDSYPGLELLSQLTGEIRLPTFAIGGIDAENLPEILETGVTRVAVGAAVSAATEPGAVTRQLLELLKTHPPEPPPAGGG